MSNEVSDSEKAEILNKSEDNFKNQIDTMNTLISELQEENKRLQDELDASKKKLNESCQNAIKALVASHDHVIAMLGVITNSVSKLQLEVILAKGNVPGAEQQQNTTTV